jgi:hypothetical protein
MMATVKKGILTTSPEWWKHLKWVKRPFWKGERQAAKANIKGRLGESRAIRQNREDERYEDR